MLILKDLSDTARELAARVYLRACPSQATGHLDSVLEGFKVKVKSFEPIDVAVEDAAFSVPTEVRITGSRPSVVKILITGVEDTQPMALPEHIYELPDENWNLLLRYAGTNKVKMDGLLK